MLVRRLSRREADQFLSYPVSPNRPILTNGSGKDTKDKLVEINRELSATDAVMGSEQPLFTGCRLRGQLLVVC